MITSSNLLQANVTVIAGIMILLGIANFSENPTAEAFDDPQEVAYAMIAPFVMSSIGALISGVKGDDENKDRKLLDAVHAIVCNGGSRNRIKFPQRY